jgi:hypothetical protein
MTITETLIEKLLSIEYSTLPQEARELAKQVAVDGMACAFAG